MALTKIQKQKIINDLKEKVDKQKSIVFADFKGIKVKDLTKLRREMKKNDCELKVAKKTLISLVLKEKKVGVDMKKFEGEIVLGFSYKDEVLPFKLLHEFSKGNENLKILGGLVGQELIDKGKAVVLGQLPSKQELLGKLVGSIKAPISNLVYDLQYNLKGLVYLLTKIKA